MEVLIGILSGIISSMGMGGGTILILCLTVFGGLEQHIAQASNLVFFIPTSLIAIILNWKNKKIDRKLAWYIVIPGVIGAMIGAIIATKLDNSILKKFFGVFLAMIAVNEIYSLVKEYRKTKKNT